MASRAPSRTPRPVTTTLLGCLVVSLSALAGCLLTTSLTDLTGGTARGPDLFSIGGTVRGLEDATIMVTGNGRDLVVVANDGPFVLGERLAKGTAYVVTALPLADGRTCSVENGEGHVADANVSNVAITCPSANADLASLVLSKGTLSPSFDAQTLSYAAPIQLSVVAPDALVPITVTATTANPTTTLTINGVPAVSGQPTALPERRTGPIIVTIVAQTADKRTQRTYTIAIAATVTETYLKASNAREPAEFGRRVAMSSDGTTLAVGAPAERGGAVGINGNQNDTSSAGSGAVYVFRRTGNAWTQEAYVKASNTRADNAFGQGLALSADGNVLAVGSPGESSDAKGINGDQANMLAESAGAAYVFRRSGSTWTQDAYVKASNTRYFGFFGWRLALSPDGATLAVAASGDASAAVGINGDQDDTSRPQAGAVFVYHRDATAWTQAAYVKSSNGAIAFGASLVLSADGMLAVGALGDPSAATGIDGDQTDTSAPFAGATFIYRRTGTSWKHEAYLKASNTRAETGFGSGLALSGEGTLAVAAKGEAGGMPGINGTETDVSAPRAGAVYVFRRTGATWVQEAFVKGSRPHAENDFGVLALSVDGKTLAVGAIGESSDATGIGGDQGNVKAHHSGAVYVFHSKGGTWTQGTYLKASNPRTGGDFGNSLALSGDGTLLVVGTPGDASGATGINGNPFDTSAPGAGAAHVYR